MNLFWPKSPQNMDIDILKGLKSLIFKFSPEFWLFSPKLSPKKKFYEIFFKNSRVQIQIYKEFWCQPQWFSSLFSLHFAMNE